MQSMQLLGNSCCLVNCPEHVIIRDNYFGYVQYFSMLSMLKQPCEKGANGLIEGVIVSSPGLITK